MRIPVTAFAVFLLASPLFATPPSITDAEKAGCEIVADHLARGPVALLERLSKQSPLSEIDRRDALDEIEARVGPAPGASWVLRTTSEAFAEKGAVFQVVFPSGVEDIVALEMVREGMGWRISGVTSMIDVPPNEVAKLPVLASTPARSGRRSNVAFLLVLAPLLAIVGAATRQKWPRTSSGILIVALVSFLLPVAEAVDPNWTVNLRRRIAGVGGRSPDVILRIGSLAALRRASTRGADLPPIGGLEGPLREVATLWKVQSEMGRVTPEETRRQLSSISAMSSAPLSHLLRARIAAADGKDEEAAREYLGVRNRLVMNDAFVVEEESIGERDSRARQYLSRSDVRTRDASFGYVRSAGRVMAGKYDEARKAFREAWRMQPITRASVISAGVFALLLRDPTFSILINFNTPDEERLADPALSRSPMKVPATTKAAASGTFVRLSIGDSSLDIPGGAAIAPSETVAVSAADLERQESEAMVVRAMQMSSHSYVSVAGQRLLERANEALAERNRWDDIVRLTDGITPQSDNLPASIVLWRVRALLRAGRNEEARRVATGVSMTHAMQRSPDVATMIETAALLEKAQAWTDASEALKTASAIAGGPDVGVLLRRIDLRRQLATSVPVATTTHFAIHTTPDVPVTVAERIGQLLEAELVRVTSRLRARSFTPVRVNVLRWDDFAGQLTFSDHVLGFYDGEITIPFGDVARFRQGVVAILTHEMTHAVIAQATSDNAPQWFQEGLAQRMELVERQENVFHIKAGRPFLAMSLVDPTMRSSVDPLAIGEAYLVAQTFIRFLEDRYGPDITTRLMTSFNEGNGSDEALIAVTGKGMTELDREFRTWGTTHSGPFVDSSPWPYASSYSLGIDPSVREGIHFSRPKP